MTGTVRTLTRVTPIDHSAAIAAQLEGLAADIRAGRSDPPNRGVLVLAGISGKLDFVEFEACGGPVSCAELVGMLELAKQQVIDG
jgi:hypothetical protein